MLVMTGQRVIIIIDTKNKSVKSAISNENVASPKKKPKKNVKNLYLKKHKKKRRVNKGIQ